MKNFKLITIAAFLLLAASSCKIPTKQESASPNIGTLADVQVKKGEVLVTIFDEVESLDNEWTIAGAFCYDINEQRIWKLKNTSTNNVVVIDPVPSDLFWQPDMKKGMLIPDALVVSLVRTRGH